MRFLSLVALAAPLVSAIQFTNPAANSTLTKGSVFDLQWSSVDTDPTAFSVYLVNFVNWPPFYTPLAVDVETSAGEASVRVPCDVDSSYGFQFNAINGTNVYIIYSQTSKFFISGDACTDPVTTAPASSCAAAPTVTQIVTVRGNSTLLASTTAPATTTAAPAPAKALVAKAQGTCPATIGWSKDYSHPVTLTETPRADRTVAVATGYVATTTLAKPTAAAGLDALTKQKSTTGSKKCSAKKTRKLKRHSDNGRVSAFKKAKRAHGL
ncbi:Serine/threonine-rich protein adg2 [Cytospora mali]|uniref:Serine/threonine-rich protein adg2 n=1 Tax=Cytospora mali TaxID=578113 RepID=A0A194V5D2_CYTMA|nr:Serine/threonine-rich protein adg2 [Valsa mali var. pyri (nom. inval.)]